MDGQALCTFLGDSFMVVKTMERLIALCTCSVSLNICQGPTKAKLLLYEQIGIICPRKNGLFGLLQCRKLIGIMEEEMHAPKKNKR